MHKILITCEFNCKSLSAVSQHTITTTAGNTLKNWVIYWYSVWGLSDSLPGSHKNLNAHSAPLPANFCKYSLCLKTAVPIKQMLFTIFVFWEAPCKLWWASVSKARYGWCGLHKKYCIKRLLNMEYEGFTCRVMKVQAEKA